MSTETESKKDNSEPHTITLGLIISYLWGAIGLILGAVYIGVIMYPISGIFFMFAGGLVFPQVRRWYEDELNIQLSRWAVATLSLICYFIGAATIP